MPDLSTIRRAVVALLGARPSAATLRAVAEGLRELAGELDRRAEADERVGHIARRVEIERPAGKRTGRPPGSGARFIRIQARDGDAGGAFVYIGRALWQDLGQPARLDPQRRGSQLVLVPTVDGGYAVVQGGNGMPRLTCGAETVQFLQLDAERRYACTIEAGAIVIGAALD